MTDYDLRPWETRAPDDRAFHRRIQHLYEHGLEAEVKNWRSGKWFGLEVTPNPGHRMATDLPPFVGSPWHLTVGTVGDHSRGYHVLIRDLMRRYARPCDMQLRFSRIKWNGIAELAHDDPVMQDPLVQQVKALDPAYRYIPLHVTM